MKKIRIGSGAGYAGDRLEPSLELIEHGALDYICYECLAERTIAIAQQARLKDPSKGYNALLEYRMNAALPLAHKHGVKIITNMGAANPLAAVEVVKRIARDKGISGIK
ncbi:MAG TPA: acyclic terpene utilization AtuA family protein, partial [Spirochaetales bacterium]|nr:acyclic terpene utilization AtuA family protein [Spirochaetales bacterium]